MNKKVIGIGFIFSCLSLTILGSVFILNSSLTKGDNKEKNETYILTLDKISNPYTSYNNNCYAYTDFGNKVSFHDLSYSPTTNNWRAFKNIGDAFSLIGDDVIKGLGGIISISLVYGNSAIGNFEVIFGWEKYSHEEIIGHINKSQTSFDFYGLKPTYFSLIYKGNQTEKTKNDNVEISKMIIEYECITSYEPSQDDFDFTYIDAATPYYKIGIKESKKASIGGIIIPSSYNDGVHGKYQVKEIAYQTFRDCPLLKAIYIPNSISIYAHLDDSNEQPFLNDKNLYSIFVEEGSSLFIKDDNDLLYYKNDSTKKLIFAPGNVKGEYTIPNDVEFICDYAFIASNITTLNINNGPLNIINAYPFINAKELQEFNVLDANDNYHAIDGVLYSKTNVLLACPTNFQYDYFTLPLNTQSIADYAFYNNQNIITFDFQIKNPSLIQIASYAFAYSKILYFWAPSTLTNIGNGAFSHCDQLETFYIDKNCNDIGYGILSYSNKVEITISSLNIKYVTSISGNYVGLVDGSDRHNNIIVSGCSKSELDQSKIGNDLYEIQQSAFEGIIFENEINLNLNSIKKIGDNAFKNSSIGDVNLTPYLSFLGSSAFENCTNIKSLSFSDNGQLNEINSKAFANCSNLVSISNFPTGLTAIKNMAFYGCEKLNKFFINSSLLEINDEAFKNCYSLSNLSIDSSSKLTILGSEVFKNVRAGFKNDLDFPSTLISIGEGCFENAQSDGSKTISFSACSLESIPKNCFKGFVIQNEVVSLDTYFRLPISINSIGESAFEDAYFLGSKFTIPDNVITIFKNAFKNFYTYSNFILGKGINEIYEGAFCLINEHGGSPYSISLEYASTTTLYKKINRHANWHNNGVNNDVICYKGTVNIDAIE